EGHAYETLGKDEQFTTKPAVESVKTSAASSVTGESATLNGSLKPEGTAAEYFFEYGPTASYGSSTTPATSSSGAEVQVSAPVTGLIPFSLYHFRLVAKRVIGGVPYMTVGQDQTIATLEGAVLIEAEQASGITPFAATLGGTVNPENSPASYYFEYGTTSVTEHLFVPPGLVSGYGSITIAPQTIQNLSPGTEYHYRLIAENAFGSVEGPEQTFKTLPASAPSINGAAVSEVGQFGASVSASIDPRGLATNYEVELEIEGSTMPVTVASAGEGKEPVAVSYTLSSLAPGTAYQVRMVAWNAAGETESQTQSFTTQSIPSDTLTQPLTPVLVPVPRIAEAKEPALIKPTTKTLTRAQKLAGALKTCKKDKSKSKRATCEKQARKKYAPAKTKKKR
ncbi:MAG TPA: fibronectin type III domain-containing protein, partial [Solirubrobacteraceae bacterium]